MSISGQDLWSEEDHQNVLKEIADQLPLYIHADTYIEDWENLAKNLADLDKSEFDYLSIIHFLLSTEVTELFEVIPRILRRLSQSTEVETNEYKCFVKGKIDWNLTIKERCAQGYDQTIYVCKPSSRLYDLPENQLLKFVLTRIKRLVEETEILPQWDR